MLKKSRYIFSLLLVFTLGLEAKSLLYKISSNHNTVYVLGSIHLARPELYPLDSKIIDAFDESDVLAVELDPSSLESQRMMQETMQRSGLYTKGKSLKTELSAKTYKVLEAYMRKSGMSVSAFKNMRPWVVMLQLSVTEMMRLGYSPELGIDKYFLDLARTQKKAIISLETAQEQMALLSKDDKDFQDKLLFYTLESMQELEPVLNEMFVYWQKGDAAAFEKIMSKPVEDDPSLQDIYDDLITKRNHTMAEKIEGFLKTDKDYFVVVGSGHVIGENGIIALLKQRGYSATQK